MGHHGAVKLDMFLTVTSFASDEDYPHRTMSPPLLEPKRTEEAAESEDSCASRGS